MRYTDLTDYIEIVPAEHPVNAEIRVPGSKSITNRALVLAALADGTSTLENALFSDDSAVCAESLRRLGIGVEEDRTAERFIVHGQGGRLPNSKADCFVGNSGTTARFLVAAAALGTGAYRFDGVARMRQRPISGLLSALRGLGANFRFEVEADHFPLTVLGQGLRGGRVSLEATDSSQFVTALLQVAPYAEQDVQITLVGEVVSEPYIEMTLKVMAQFDVSADKVDYRNYFIRSGQKYRAQTYFIEPDASNATYFFAAAALTNGRVRVPYLNADSLQGDAHFVDVLEQMGCTVYRGADYLEVHGTDRLRGIEIDLNAMSDTSQTLAAIAPFATAPVTIRNIGHNRLKETDRISAVAVELRKLGAKVDELPDGLVIYPSTLHGAAIDTYDDHRMAMAFAVIGLRQPGVRINNPNCTAKTFPDYFTRFQQLYG
ncbi:MAG: 3-phosphoshikimate 1-carboxyvinyltransferase [Anaerolineae bacterium]